LEKACRYPKVVTSGVPTAGTPPISMVGMIVRILLSSCCDLMTLSRQFYDQRFYHSDGRTSWLHTTPRPFLTQGVKL